MLSPLLRDYAKPLQKTTNSASVTTSKSKSSSGKRHWLLLCNAQSLFYKLDELRALTRATNPTFVCVTESWLTPEIDDDIVQMAGFCSFRHDRRDNPSDLRKGGGTIVYAASSVSPVSVNIPPNLEKPSGIECCLIAFHDPDLSYLLCIYIPPGIPIQTFRDFQLYVTSVFDFLLDATPEANLFVCGDLNQFDFSFLSQYFDLYNIVDFATFRNHTLDKFLCKKSAAKDFKATSAPPLGSATYLHNIVFISKNTMCLSNDTLLYKVYDMRSSNVKRFCDLANTDWKDIFSTDC